MMSANVRNIIDRITLEMEINHACQSITQIFYARCLEHEIWPPRPYPNLRYYHATSIECAYRELPSGAYACVLALFDPTSHASVKQLEEICKVARHAGVPVATIATFNPSWIDNLMHHFDVAQHFREFPSEDSLRAVSDSFHGGEGTRQ